MTATIMIALGGALGSVARYWAGIWAAPLSQELPWGTIGINVIGSCLIGFIATLTLPGGRLPAPEWVRLFFMTGICGGFTTFSAFSLQTLDLLRIGALDRACINIAGSVLLCLAAVWLGHTLASSLGVRSS